MTLKLIKKPDKNEFSNFWSCCPLQNEFLPEKECPEAKPEYDKSKKVLKEPKCQWWINSKKYNYCFWKYIKENSNSHGEMPEMPQSDLAKLFGWSNTKAHFMLKEAMDEFIKVIQENNIDINIEELAEEYNLPTLKSTFTNSDDY